MILKIKGDIVSNDLKPIYDWFEIESTSPGDVTKALEALQDGEKLEVKINSGGGDAMAGQEIYSVLRARDDVEIEIESVAASAASIIAMAGHCLISPVGIIMIHNVSTGIYGNHKALEKEANTLRQWDNALANAYVEKTGRPKEDILRMMEKETWITADRAVELGFVDGITEPAQQAVAVVGGLQVTPDMVEEYKQAMKAREAREAEKQALLDSLKNYGN